MWIAADEDGSIGLFINKPERDDGLWTDPNGVDGPDTMLFLPKETFPQLTWEHEPIEVGLIELNAINEELIDDSIVLTRYYEDYEKEHEGFVNMLKHQEEYKDCTDEEIEKIWKDGITEKYTFDEIRSTIQCEGYTKIVLRMGRHDIQPDYDCVLETKEYIDEKIKNRQKGSHLCNYEIEAIIKNKRIL